MKISIHLAPSCYRAIVLSLKRAYFWFACNERDFSEVTHFFISQRLSVSAVIGSKKLYAPE